MELEFYCMDHEVPCCATCSIVIHRRCERVDTLLKVAQNSKLSDLSVKLQKALATEVESLKTMEQDCDVFSNEIVDTCDAMKTTVLRKQNMITKHNEVLAQAAVCNISEVKRDMHSRIQAHVDICEERTKMMENLKRLYLSSKTHFTDAAFFLESQKMEKKFLELSKNSISTNSLISVNSNLKFQMSRALENVLKCKSFGDIDRPQKIDGIDKEGKRP